VLRRPHARWHDRDSASQVSSADVWDAIVRERPDVVRSALPWLSRPARLRAPRAASRARAPTSPPALSHAHAPRLREGRGVSD
jgi:hypothetical protein